MHRVYQMLEEEDNIQFMAMIDNTTNSEQTENDTKLNSDNFEVLINKIEVSQGETDNKDTDELNDKRNEVFIKTETRTGYVNLDGTEREKGKNESLKDVLKERINNFFNKTAINEKEMVKSEETVAEKRVDVDDIIIPQKPEEDKIELPSTARAKETMKLLPKVIQDFLNSDWKRKPKCEPQHMLERMRRENRYPDHPAADRYELLLTPVPSFLQRISLAGEFLNKKQLEV